MPRSCRAGARHWQGRLRCGKQDQPRRQPPAVTNVPPWSGRSSVWYRPPVWFTDGDGAFPPGRGAEALRVCSEVPGVPRHPGISPISPRGGWERPGRHRPYRCPLEAISQPSSCPALASPGGYPGGRERGGVEAAPTPAGDATAGVTPLSAFARVRWPRRRRCTARRRRVTASPRAPPLAGHLRPPAPRLPPSGRAGRAASAAAWRPRRALISRGGVELARARAHAGEVVAAQPLSAAARMRARSASSRPAAGSSSPGTTRA